MKDTELVSSNVQSKTLWLKIGCKMDFRYLLVSSSPRRRKGINIKSNTYLNCPPPLKNVWLQRARPRVRETDTLSVRETLGLLIKRIVIIMTA